MDYQDITYEVDGNAAVITLNRPEKLNAWTGRMDQEYKDALQRADDDRGVRGVILTGAGRGFCAGADMSMLNSIAEAGAVAPSQRAPFLEAETDRNYLQPFSYPLATKKPLLGAINGAAAGLGMVHTLYCDIRIASEKARFTTSFAPLGLVAEHGISWLLPRIIGPANALDLLYSSRMVGAEEALRLGLVSRVVPHDELLPACKEYIAALERCSPAAMATSKRLVYDALFSDLATATRAANAAMDERITDPEFKEGLAAFAERRVPAWQGLGR